MDFSGKNQQNVDNTSTTHRVWLSPEKMESQASSQRKAVITSMLNAPTRSKSDQKPTVKKSSVQPSSSFASKTPRMPCLPTAQHAPCVSPDFHQHKVARRVEFLKHQIDVLKLEKEKFAMQEKYTARKVPDRLPLSVREALAELQLQNKVKERQRKEAEEDEKLVERYGPNHQLVIDRRLQRMQQHKLEQQQMQQNGGKPIALKVDDDDHVDPSIFAVEAAELARRKFEWQNEILQCTSELVRLEKLLANPDMLEEMREHQDIKNSDKKSDNVDINSPLLKSKPLKLNLSNNTFFVKDPHRVHPTFLTPRSATSPLASTRSITESLAPLRPLPSPKVPIFDNYTPRPSASSTSFSATKTLSTDAECLARNPLDLRFLSLQCLDDLQPLTAQAKFDRQSELNRFMFAHQHTEQTKQDHADSNNETNKNEDMRTFSMLATLWNSDTKTAVESDSFAAQQHTVLKSNNAAFVPQSPFLPTAATEQLRKMHGLPPIQVETTDPNAADVLPYSSKSQQSLLATALDTQALSLAYNELVSLQGFQSNLSDRVLHFHHLRWLDLSHNKLCEVPADVLALCPNLQHLSIAHNAFTESQLVTLILQVADALKHLTSLSLQNCPGSSEWQAHPYYRSAIAITLPNLLRLDGQLITPVERRVPIPVIARACVHFHALPPFAPPKKPQVKMIRSNSMQTDTA